MVDLSKYTPSIEIHLDSPGVYVFPNSSAMGKSYLCKLLSDLRLYERVDSFTFSDLGKVDVVKLFDSDRVSVVMLDRYDMYCGQFLDEINKFSKKGIVLVDCKSYRFPFSVKSCGIYLYEDRIVVL